MKKIIFSLIFLIFLVGCTITEQEMEQKVAQVAEQVKDVEPCGDWRGYELTDAVTGEKFHICDFENKTVLLESFAVWCPTCKKQQDKIKELHEEVGDAVISISIDTDPNEDENKVIEHVNRHGYDWRFTVAPIEFTSALVEEFGISVVNAPGAPVILICEDQSARLLGRGVKSASKLKEDIAKC